MPNLRPVAGIAGQSGRKSFTRSFLGGAKPNAGLQLPKPMAPKQPQAPKQPGFVGGPKPPKPPSPVAKSRDEIPSKRRIAHQKRVQAATSITGGTLGLAALAARGHSSMLNRAVKSGKLLPTQAKEVKAKSQKLTDASTYLTTTGAGVGGVGAYNFASYTNAEGKRDIKKNLEEDMSGTPFMPYGEPDPFEQVSKKVPMRGPLFRTQRGTLRRAAKAKAKQRDAFATYQTNIHAGVKRDKARTAQKQAMGTYSGNLGWTRANADKLPSAQKPPSWMESSRLGQSYNRNPDAYKAALATAAGGTATGGAVGFYAGKRKQR